MYCSYMVFINPHMKPRIELIIMKIFMKIVKICPKSMVFKSLPTYRYRFHEMAALRAIMHAARPFRENGDDIGGQNWTSPLDNGPNSQRWVKSSP